MNCLKQVAVVLGLLVMLFAVSPASAAVYFSDDFEAYGGNDLFVTLIGGWSIIDVAGGGVIEDSTWTITNPGGRANPPTIDGTPSTGAFMVSDSDAQSKSGDQDTGNSHDLWTPSFSTGAGAVWLHADVSAQLNNNGAAIFDVEVSTDGGGSWSNAYSGVAPGRGDLATTRLPDNTNADGYFGQLDVDLSAVASNQPDVKVRFRQYEPDWDWWIAIDNVLVDDVAPPEGAVTVFSEDFSSKGALGSMIVDGLNTGTETWSTIDKGNRYTAGAIGQKDVNRLMHPTPEGPNGEVEFAIMNSDADPDQPENEYLMTPLLDLNNMLDVFLHFTDELERTNPANGNETVLLMQDTGNGAPDMGDTVLKTILNYNGGGLTEWGEEPFYAERTFSVPEAAGLSNVFFAFRFESIGDQWWWAVDDVRVTGNLVPEPSTIVLLASGVLGLLLYLRRRKR